MGTEDEGAVAKAKARASQAIGQGREKAGQVVLNAKETSYRAADAANRLLNEHPIATAAAAAAAGALIGLMLPRARVAHRIGKTASRAARFVAAAETTRTVLASLAGTAQAARKGARDLADSAVGQVGEVAASKPVRRLRKTAAHAVDQARDVASGASKRAGRAIGKIKDKAD
jgi:ElaB/YqjD/DUF883 family membrane-anchored ribosome-binding protein